MYSGRRYGRVSINRRDIAIVISVLCLLLWVTPSFALGIFGAGGGTTEGGGGPDVNAVHVNASGEIAGIVDKATPLSADHLLLEDSAAGNAKRDVTVGSLTSVFATDVELAAHESDTTVHGVDTATLLKGGVLTDTKYCVYASGTGLVNCTADVSAGGTDANAIHGNAAGEIAAIADKAIPVAGDHLLIEDSAAANAKKDITVSSLTSVFATDAELSAHTGATVAHGIDTTTLATDAELAAHASATTVHGVDTTLLVDTNDIGVSVQAFDADLSDLADGSLTGTKVGFADSDNNWTATNVQTALEELDDVIGGGIPNQSTGKVDWSQLVNVPAGFADNVDDSGAGGADADAIHDNVAGEITAIADKATPVGADHLLIEDSAASNAKKDITISSLTSVFATDTELATHNSATAVHGVDTTLLLDTADVGVSVQAFDADLSDLADGSLTGTKVGFADTDNNWTATDVQTALEELDNVIGGGLPNQATGKVDWSQLTNVPAGFADGADDAGAGGGDADAIHDNVAGEIAAIADKATPVGADHLLIEDSESSAPTNAKKDITISSLTSVFATDSELSTHNSATSVHGIDTTTLATDAELETHRVDQTDVHGIADTSLVLIGGTLTDTKLCTWNDTAGVVQCNTDPAEGLGDVVGPASSTLNAVPRYSSTTGKAIKDSAVTVSDAGIVTAASYETTAVSANGGILRLCEDADLDPENDCFVIRMPDNVNIPDGDTIHDIRSDAKLKATAIAGSYVITNSKAATYTLGTDDPMEMYGGVLYVTAAATVNLPVVAPGMSFSVITIGAVAVSINPDNADTIWLDGTTTGTAGDKITNTSTTGDMAVCTYRATSTWYCATGSNDGDPWTDTGP